LGIGVISGDTPRRPASGGLKIAFDQSGSSLSASTPRVTPPMATGIALRVRLRPGSACSGNGFFGVPI